jgi:hypothetical protein
MNYLHQDNAFRNIQQVFSLMLTFQYLPTTGDVSSHFHARGKPKNLTPPSPYHNAKKIFDILSTFEF